MDESTKFVKTVSTKKCVFIITKSLHDTQYLRLNMNQTLCFFLSNRYIQTTQDAFEIQAWER